MKPVLDVYLSLAMHGRVGKEVLDQINYAKALCTIYGLTYYAPTDDEHVDPHKIIDKKPNRKLMESFVRKDDKHVDICRSLLVLTGDKSSSGVGWEMARMHYKNKRPIVVVAPRMYDKLLVNFTTIKAAKVCVSQKQAILWLRKELK